MFVNYATNIHSTSTFYINYFTESQNHRIIKVSKDKLQNTNTLSSPSDQLPFSISNAETAFHPHNPESEGAIQISWTSVLSLTAFIVPCRLKNPHKEIVQCVME